MSASTDGDAALDSQLTVEVDVALARRLVDRQFAAVDPVAAAAELTPLASGWDNRIFRLGTAYTVRLPHRWQAVSLVRNEARWVPVAAGPVPVAVPTPVFLGGPDAGYPWPWSVCRWVDGEVLSHVPVNQRGGVVDGLADALLALHRPAPADAPANPYRGVPLAARTGVVRQRILDWHGPVQPLLRAWDAGLEASRYPGPPLWLHGDPHPLNLTSRDGALSGLLDFGDITAGDPASDLATAWWTFAPVDRARFVDRINRHGTYDDQVWRRAAAWAAGVASAMGPGSGLEAMALHTAEQLAQDLG